MQKDTETFCPASRHQWRMWLAENHGLKTGVWLIHYKKQAGKESLTWSEAVDEALCFGWIDSIRQSIDADSFRQFFSPRKPNSAWSKVNKTKAGLLITEGRMEEAGLACIKTAKKNGSWQALDLVEKLTIPKDLQAALKMQRGAKPFFLSHSKSVRKSMLQWIAFAKRPETRQKRIAEIAELAGKKMKPRQF